MASRAILVMNSGRWDNDNCYVDYTIYGLFFKESSSYNDLYKVIAMQLGIDTNMNKLKIEYNIEEGNTPMLIHNDMGVRLYIMLKNAANEFNKYPLCINKLPSIIGTNELCGSSNQDSDTITSISINENDEFDNRQPAYW